MWPKKGEWHSRKSTRLGVKSLGLISPCKSLRAFGHIHPFCCVSCSVHWTNTSLRLVTGLLIRALMLECDSHLKELPLFSGSLGALHLVWSLQYKRQTSSHKGRANQSSMAIHSHVTCRAHSTGICSNRKIHMLVNDILDPPIWAVAPAWPNHVWQRMDHVWLWANDTDETHYCLGGLSPSDWELGLPFVDQSPLGLKGGRCIFVIKYIVTN